MSDLLAAALAHDIEELKTDQRNTIDGLKELLANEALNPEFVSDIYRYVFKATETAMMLGIAVERVTVRDPEIQRKVDAYDRARAQVKIEGPTRAELILRAEAAEEKLAEYEPECGCIAIKAHRPRCPHADYDR